MITITCTITEFAPGKIELRMKGEGLNATQEEARVANKMRDYIGVQLMREEAKSGNVVLGPVDRRSPPATSP